MNDKMEALNLLEGQPKSIFFCYQKLKFKNSLTLYVFKLCLTTSSADHFVTFNFNK